MSENSQTLQRDGSKGELYELPEGWCMSKISNLCTQPQYGYTTKASDEGELKLLRTTDITKGKIDWDLVPFCSANPDDPDKYLLKEGDIVISRAGSVGFSYLLEETENSVFASYLIRFRPYIDKRFFKYFLDSPLYWREISEKKLGIAIPNVNANKLKQISLPLPPFPEQQRIVSKLEELFSELDKGIESFKTAREQLTVYRQAVLKHAFEGRLTKEWRTQHAGELEPAETLLEKIKAEREQRYQQKLDDWKRAVNAWEAGGKEGRKPTKPGKPKELPPLTEAELAKLPEPPEGWGWYRAGWLFESVTSGSRWWAKYYSDEGAIFIRITNLNFDALNLDLTKDKIQHIEPPNNAEGLRTRVQEGDFLFSITGYLGMFAIAPKIDEAYVNQHIALARPLPGFSKQYLGYYITAKTGGHHHLNKLTKGAVKAGLGLEDIQSFPFPMCSQEEQKKIVEKIESRLSVAEKLEQGIADGLQQAEALRQSLLKKAFEGRLVPQDPNDEPASVLLERIKREKAKLKQKALKQKEAAV